MAIDRLLLSKLLETIQQPHEARLRFIERDARRSSLKEKLNLASDGRDFYGDFWADAKLSVVRQDFDLTGATADRVKANRSKRNLYPRLLVGFQNAWATVQNRIDHIVSINLIYGVTADAIKIDDASVRISNPLVLRNSSNVICVMYPYFSKEIALGTKSARLGLHALCRCVPQNDNTEYVLMDVLRETAFLKSDARFSGSEQEQLTERYEGILREWRVQRRLHGGR